MKARHSRWRCACCGAPIYPGDQVTRHDGQVWLTSHLLTRLQRWAVNDDER